LESCGESVSTFKDTARSVAANAISMARDEILKNTFANNAFEDSKIASYK